MNAPQQADRLQIAKWQLRVGVIYLTMLALLLTGFFWRDRQQEWQLRQEQARHRLDLAYELISRDLQRVQSDALFLANHQDVQRFVSDPGAGIKSKLKAEFTNFVTHKQSYQQLRLLSLDGQEQFRVERQTGEVWVTPAEELQDKRDRYYFQESRDLNVGEVFVSDFDLNQEHGVVETPYRPVIRFITPVAGKAGQPGALLVLNYLGTPLLNELASISMPGQTWLVRDDGQYLLAARPDLAWGWLLGHKHSFADTHPNAWKRRSADTEAFLDQQGAVAFREIQLQPLANAMEQLNSNVNSLYIVSFLPSEQVFEKSKQLLGRLMLLGFVSLLPVIWLVRLWVQAAIRKQHQNKLLVESESKLRELSSRLVQIQEDERRSISREIHDQLGQQATAINLDLKLAARHAPASMAEQLQRTIDESQQLLDTLHDFAARIRPVELDDLGLQDALSSHIESFSARTGIASQFKYNVIDADVPEVVAENVYRLVQEALNNVAKHSNARQLTVEVCQLDASEFAQPGQLKLLIRDDGVGVEQASELAEGKPLGRPRRSDQKTSGLGLLGMQERVELLGGSIELISAPDQGTRIEAYVPIG